MGPYHQYKTIAGTRPIQISIYCQIIHLGIVFAFLGRGGFVHARSWRDVLTEGDTESSLRGSNNKKLKGQHHSRPGELSFEIENDPFYFPSFAGDSFYHTENEKPDINAGKREHPFEDDSMTAFTITNSSMNSENDVSTTTSTITVQSNTKTAKSKPPKDDVFLHQSIPSVASKRDIKSYRTSREFIPPTESLLMSENDHSVSRTDEAGRYVYPDNSVLPVPSPEWGYFNYDTSEESWYGPGHPVISSTSQQNVDLVVEYANNGWKDYQPPPPIPPLDAMAIANDRRSDDGYRDYFYWDEFGPEGLGFGTWKDTLRNIRNSPNQCGGVGRQSPIDIRPNGVACLEHHQIRSRRGDFRVFGNKNNLGLSILPNKLQVGIRRRPCKDINNPVCSEPDPPHADFPHHWPGFIDVLHVDFKFPAEHRINGRIYDGEMQIYHLHPGRRRLPVVSVLMEVMEVEEDQNAGHNDYLQEAIDGFQYEYDANRAKCADAAINFENRRLHLRNHKSKKNDLYDPTSNRKSMIERNSSLETKKDALVEQKEKQERTQEREQEDLDGHKSWKNHSNSDNSRGDSDIEFPTIEELANIAFGGDRIQLEKHARLLKDNSEFSAQKDIHRRRLSEVWNPHHESLVPSIYFYGYDGSLTEPPCSEIVSWFVIDEPMKISRNQLEHMKFLLFTNVDGSTCHTTSVQYRSSVARPIQDTGANRQIWHCTSDEFLPD